MARTRGWLLPLVAAPLVLVLAAVVAGFIFPSHRESRILAIDVRTNPLPAAQVGTIAQEQRDKGVAQVVLVYLDPQKPSCTGTACDGVTTIADIRTMDEALKALYGPDTQTRQDDQTKWWHTTITTSKFNTAAAFLTAGLLAVVAIAVGWLIGARPSVPAAPRAQQVIGSPADPPPRGAARAGPNQAIARSHVSAAGGYVELGEIVVWAVLSPHARTVAAPGDLLDVLETDQKNAVLTVAPALAAAQRGSTP
jgi:hypothetical protein